MPTVTSGKTCIGSPCRGGNRLKELRALLWGTWERSIEPRMKPRFYHLKFSLFLFLLPSFMGHAYFSMSPSLMVHFVPKPPQMKLIGFNWSLPRTMMKILKPGHVFKQRAASHALQHWYYHCGEQGWGTVVFNMAGSLVCSERRVTNVAPPHIVSPERHSWKSEENQIKGNVTRNL